MNLNDSKRALAELGRAVESGAPEDIARVAMFNIWPLLTAHTDVLIAAVSGLPSATLENYPALRLVHPMTAVLARTTRPFAPVLHPDHARSMSAEEVDIVLLTQMIASRASGDLEAALLYAKRLRARIRDVRVESRDRPDGPLWFFHHQIGSTLLAAGDSAQALLAFATARQLGRMSAQPDAERAALGRVALAHAVRGALGDAEQALAEARKLPAPTPAHLTLSTSTEHAAAALIGVDRMDENLPDLLAALTPLDSTDLAWPFALLARARGFLNRQLPEDALEASRLARDSHPVQPGSFAFDVIGAISIETFVQMSDVTRARRAAEAHAEAGVLTRIATIRLALHDHRPDAAADKLRELSQAPGLGPAQRAECVLLSAWLQVLRTDELDADTATRIYHVVRRPDNRRITTKLPRRLIERTRENLDGDAAREFDIVTGALTYVEVAPRPVLTPGELRVLNALLHHDSTASIAAAFQVSPNTVKSQLRSLYRKLDCSTRGEALRIATRMHLLSPDG